MSTILQHPHPLPPGKEAAIPLDLIERLRHRQVIAFLGAGLSVPLGLPSWRQLIASILGQVNAATYNPDPRDAEWLRKAAAEEPEWAAEVLHEMGPDKYFEAIQTLFRNRPTAPFSFAHSLLAQLPFRLYLTTNFDTVVEDYVSFFDWHDPVVLTHREAWQASAWADDSARRVLKVHGSVDKDAQQIVLRSSDYKSLLCDDLYYQLLASLFSRFAVITLGYSLRDREFHTLIEERQRRQLDCPPMYSVIGESETCPAEIATYKTHYNVRIIPVSQDEHYAEVTSLLLSLYCLVHRVDSSAVGADILRIIDARGTAIGVSRMRRAAFSADEERALRLLSVFREPVELPLFTALCTDNGIHLTPAHYHALACDDGTGRIGVKQGASVEPSDRVAVAEWLARELDRVPVGSAPRYFSIYHKMFLDRHVGTIVSLLSSVEGWRHLILEGGDASRRMEHLNEYLRQAGLWTQWLAVAEIGEPLVAGNTDLTRLLLRTKAWVYFWTRRYGDLRALLDRAPEIDDKQGESSYRERLRYMDRQHLEEFVRTVSTQSRRDYFSDSLLGRAHARLATTKTDEQERKRLFESARGHIQKALAEARKRNDLIETSVQSWYLACVLSDLKETGEAQAHLAEVRRLDEAIMARVPGLAWLRVAEYRFELNRPQASPASWGQKRAEAIEAMTRLGVLDPAEFVDKDYYF
jgi:hypothetical protein